ncbi:hypothetical protein RN98_11135 [Fusobacterium animalis]|uniref:Uncharacterized protein n=1 Tax=Fusobacterium animalis TaxID=76859 RepID=A0A0M4SRH3_9FUSO|nr:hypothetical protein RN98_11135 [Fusobacterium animalis]
MDFSFLKCPFEEACKRLYIIFRVTISSVEGYFLEENRLFYCEFYLKNIVILEKVNQLKILIGF